MLEDCDASNRPVSLQEPHFKVFPEFVGASLRRYELFCRKLVFRTGRNSIGVEFDAEYCRLSARYLKAENVNLFSNAKLFFEKVEPAEAYLVKEDQVLYEVRPAKKKLE